MRPAPSEISDLQNFYLHGMCACTEWYCSVHFKYAEKTYD